VGQFFTGNKPVRKKRPNQVATFLTIVGEQAHEVYPTLTWNEDGDDKKINLVLEKFAKYCQPI